MAPVSRFLLSSLMLSLAVAGISLPANAGPLPWRDDPDSAVDDRSLQGRDDGPNANTRTLSNLTVVNFSTKPISDLLVMIAWFWPLNSPVNMAWSNTLGGWFTNNYLGTSLLVTLDNFPGRIRFGDVAADPAGQVPLGATHTYLGVPETRDPNDGVPFLDLGAFAPLETKPFTASFTFHFGDNRSGNPGAEVYSNTLSPTPSAIPEPSSLALILIAGLLAPLRTLVRGRADRS